MLEALNRVLDRAQLAPIYSGRLPRRVRDDEGWQALPLTTKADLRAAYPFGLLAVPKNRLATYHESSGSSGEPTSSYFTESDWQDVASRFARNAVELGPDDTLLVKTPYSMVTTAHQAHRAGRLRGALVVPADNRSSNMPYAKVVRLLADLPVTVAWCMPTETLLWAAAARLAGFDPAADFPAFRAFLVAGEAMSAAKRRRIGELWSARVFEDYGSTETGSLGGECAAGRLHLWADRLYVEVLDPATGRTAPSGRGQLVVTPLEREAMPLVRYLLEDTVQVDDAPCVCGSALPTVRVLGRTATAAELDGHPLYPVDLEEAVYSLPIERGVTFWRARLRGGAAEVELAAAPAEAGAAVAELAAILATRLELGRQACSRLSIRAVAVETLVPPSLLTAQSTFLKPRFVFTGDESWSSGLTY